MIGTVTVNPCIDKTVSVEMFDLYRMNRVRVLCTDPSGKGINVSKTLAAMGVDTLCTGFDFSEDGVSPLAADLAGCGIPYDPVPVRGALRVCTKIIDESRRHTIELNERGAAVTPSDGERMLQKIKEVAKRCSFLTLSGSLPQGLDKDFYARAVKEIKACVPDCRVVVDAEGELLTLALAESPFLIKPNIHEFEATFDCKIDSIESLDAKVQEILARYELGMICVSLGEKGAYIATRSEAYCCLPVPVEVRSLQGAGDAMVVGLCMALEKDLPLCEVLRYGVAMAGAAIATEGTRPGTRAEVERLLQSGIAVEKVR